ncbi:AI-2E family transporter [Sulfitobacter sabulilitoris]|uniref:AI-2E family transporter n=1 Tax=Sulfitobacter sabulilitoris TaxID=2562655 RepID=A0A5S3PIJ4_9RHOB|nr:AI-2E family transporter [Sulfitobacter sabulilitoris]TMM54178.1 AI-2E family transporter [Sulfitobacter sabulilitoris]
MEHLAGIRRALQILVLLGLFSTAYFAKDMLLPVLLGFLVALTLSPVSRGLNRIGIPHAVSAILLIGATALSVTLVVVFSAGTVASWANEAPAMGREIQRKLRGVVQTVETVREASEQVEKIGESATSRVQEVVIKQPSLIDNAMDTVTNVGATIAVTLVLALFLLASGDMFYVKLVKAIPTMSGKKRALSAVYDVERRVSRYLLTITLINAGLGLAIGSYLTLLGLESGYIWGVAAFLLNFLPYVGGFVGTIMVGAYAITAFDSLSFALLAPLGYQVMTGIEGQLVTPYLVGRRLELNTVAVFLTVVFWGWLWGIAGALIAVPFLVVFKVVCENFEQLHTVGNFLSKSDDRADSARTTEA